MNEIGAVNTPAPFAGLDVTWNRFQENSVLLKASAGETRIKLGPNFPGAGLAPAPLTKTGLTNDANTYSATFLIDGTIRAFAAAGNTMQTIADLVSVLNAALAAWATVTLVNDTIVVASLTTGVASAVFVSDNTLGSQPDPRLFANIKGAQHIVTVGSETFVAGSPRFGVEDYDSTRSWFGIVGTVVSATNRVGRSVRGNNLYFRFDNAEAVHQAQISAVVDAFLSAAGATNQPWLNAESSIAITGNTVAALPSNNTEINRATVYQLRLNVDGHGDVVVFVDMSALVETQVLNTATPGVYSGSFATLVQAINVGIAAAVQADGTPLPVVAEWQQGVTDAAFASKVVFRVLPSNTLFTTAATGAVLQGTTSSLVITDGASNGLIAAITAAATPINWAAAIVTAYGGRSNVLFNRVNAAAVDPTTVPAIGAGGSNYDVTATLDGVTKTVTVSVTSADTLTVIAASLQVALRAAVTGFSPAVPTVVAAGNGFILASDTTGFASGLTVTIPTAGANPDLFNAIAAGLDVVDPRGNTSVLNEVISGFATPGVDGATNLTFPQTVNTVVYNNWYDVFNTVPVGGRAASSQYIHGLTGFGPLYTSDSALVFIKELRPTSLGQCVDRTVYWDNTNTVWRYLSVDGFGTDASRALTDDVSAGANNPPQLETLASGV